MRLDAAGDPRAVVGALRQLADGQFLKKLVKMATRYDTGRSQIENVHDVLARTKASTENKGLGT